MKIRISVFLVACIAMLAPSIVIAQTKVVVVQLFGDVDRKIGNVVTVAKENGDFTDVLSAMASIQDANATNPYLIVIGPGKYALTESLQVKPFVSISGSGQDSTELAMVTPNRATLTLADDISSVSIGNLTVRNSVAGARSCTAVQDGFGDVNMSNVSLISTGCSISNVALSDVCGSSKYTNVSILASGQSATGIQSCALAGKIFMENMDIRVFGETSSFGVSSSFATFDIRDSSINVSGRGSVIGIRLQNIIGSSLIESTEINSGAIGIQLIENTTNVSELATMIVRRSTVSGESGSIFGDATAIFNVAQSTLIGPTGGANNTALKTCVASDNGSGVALTASCQ